MHFASHAVTHPLASPSPAELYPQHAEMFNRIDRPLTVDDLEMRNALEARTRGMLNAAAGQNYSTSCVLPICAHAGH